jgi:outer membrane protein assembly factor BamB
MRRLTTLCVLLFVSAASAEDWPGWRGPRGDGTSTEKGLPLRWTATENVAWKTPIPGTGHSSPVVYGDRVFVTTCVSDDVKKEGQRKVFCVDRRDGKVVWERTALTSHLEQKHRENSFSSATPATDGERLYVTFLEDRNGQPGEKDRKFMVVVCYDLDGKELWRQSPGKLLSVHGFCTSPVLHKGLVILNGDQDATAYIVALDKKTGREVWRADRPNRTRSYCTPILIVSAKRPDVTQLVLSGSKCVTGYDADSGKLLWQLDGPTEQYVASLVFQDQILFLTTGFPEFHLMGLSPDGQGKINGTPFVLWHIGHKENGPKGAAYVPSPIAADGHFFVVSDVGYLGCVEERTGKRLWLERLGKHHHASPVLADGHIYIPDDDGVTWVLKASSTFAVVAKNPLGEEVYASPAVSRGQIFLRGARHLYCIGAGAKGAE